MSGTGVTIDNVHDFMEFEMDFSPEEVRGLHEECGVFAYADFETPPDGRELPIALNVYLGLKNLQHRGQEAGGVSWHNGTDIVVVRKLGLLDNLDQPLAAAMDEHPDGRLGMGQVRYGTQGGGGLDKAQPIHRKVNEGEPNQTEFALGHNGNLTNTEELREEYEVQGNGTDSDLVAELIAIEMSRVVPGGEVSPLVAAIEVVAPKLKGAFSFVLMDSESIIGVRDSNGIRPLMLGQDPETKAYVLASETPALDITAADYIREIDAGEMIVINKDGYSSTELFKETDPKLCLFEFAYFARPDGELYGQSVNMARELMGERLAVESPAEVDIVAAVPDSGIPAARGYSRESDVPLAEVLFKNRYVGRSFILQSPELRTMAVRMKFNPISEQMDDKRVLYIDDSIVRGTTFRKISHMSRLAGAKEVHLRLTTPPIMWPCFYGMDYPNKNELIANQMTIDEMAEALELDSLAFISLDGLKEATQVPGEKFCAACFDGHYPAGTPQSKQIGHVGVRGTSVGIST